MSKKYPYLSEKKCIICGSDIIIKKSYVTEKKFCGNKCRIAYWKRISEESKSKKTKLCEQCKNPFVPNISGQRFCNKECWGKSLVKNYPRLCECCGKEFFVNNISQINRGDHRFCSQECSKKKYTLDEVDFSQQTPEKIYWLGFIFAATLEFREEDVQLIGTKFMLEEFKRFFKSTAPLQPNGSLFRVIISSRSWCRHLSIMGLRIDFYKEAPIIETHLIKDFIRGYFDSHRGFVYKEVNKNIVAIHGEDSKLMRYFSDMLNAALVYKDKEWIVVCRDFEISCNGLPKNKEKWKKFISSPKSF